MSTTRRPRFIQMHVADSGDERVASQAGLMQERPSISPKYFYDKLGSHLFEAITELPEYYPTRTEARIFEAHGPAVGDAVGIGSTMFDLGAGNCAKAMSLFPILEPKRYVAIDISAEFLREALQGVQREQPNLDVFGIGLDLMEPFALPAEVQQGRPVFFYPGSSIGNFTRDAALEFLTKIRSHANGGGILIGVDLVKPAEVLEPAYDDALGVTSAFNLNLLRHVNRTIAADFDPRDWRHVAFWNAADSRIEMHVEARRAVTVHWDGGERAFAAGQRIHTENSCKYTVEDFAALLQDAGFDTPLCWTDERGWFAVFWAGAT